MSIEPARIDCVERVIDTSQTPSEKDSALWKCIAETILANGERDFSFCLRTEFNEDKADASIYHVREDRNRVQDDIFPALEDIPYNLNRKLNPDIGDVNELFASYRCTLILKEYDALIKDGVAPQAAVLAAIELGLEPLDGKELIAEALAKKLGAGAMAARSFSLRHHESELNSVLEQNLCKIRAHMLEVIEYKERMDDESELLSKLGIAIAQDENDDWIFRVPDRVTLLKRWNALRADNPKLPELKIAPSEGIASDMDFIKALTENNLLWSSGKEFIHDFQSHVLPCLCMILAEDTFQEFSYQEYVGKFQSLVKRLHDTLVYAEERGPELVTENELIALKKLSGAIVDSLSAITKPSPNVQNERGPIVAAETLMRSESWRHYFNKAFRSIEIRGESKDKLRNLIEKMRQVQVAYEASGGHAPALAPASTGGARSQHQQG